MLCAFVHVVLPQQYSHSPRLYHVCVQEASCGFVIILMALYWCTECMPLAVTGLLPVILFPMMGIMESSEVPTLLPSPLSTQPPPYLMTGSYPPIRLSSGDNTILFYDQNKQVNS